MYKMRANTIVEQIHWWPLLALLLLIGFPSWLSFYRVPQSKMQQSTKGRKENKRRKSDKKVKVVGQYVCQRITTDIHFNPDTWWSTW